MSLCVPFSWPHSCHTLRMAHYTVTPSARADTRRADWHWVWPLLVSSAWLPCPFPALKPSPVCCVEAHSADKQTVLCNRINGAMDWRSLRNLLFAVTWAVLLEGQTKRWWHYSHINICFTIKRKADFGQCLQGKVSLCAEKWMGDKGSDQKTICKWSSTCKGMRSELIITAVKFA